MNTTDPHATNPEAGVLRQLIASVYDGLLLLAVLLIASALTVPLTQAGIIKASSPLISIYLLLICFLFYAWFWVHGGQTLGMHVWHIRIEQTDGKPITWTQALIRFITGLPAWILLVLSLIRFYVPEKFQLDYFPGWLLSIEPVWILLVAAALLWIDRCKSSWRDKVSGTHIIVRK